jgi:putative transposase
VWQGRFKAFPIQQDEHLLAVLRYVERNALRANLVKRAQDWTWCSLRERLTGQPSELLHSSPVALPRNWPALVNRPQTVAELAALRRSVVRGTPFGEDAWIKRTARRLGLEFTLKPRGRPKKPAPK